MKKLAFLVATMVLFITGAAMAAGPQPWQMDFQPAASPMAERIHDFHNMLLVIITAITAFVFALLLIVMIRFNAKANPKPAQFTHNVLLEVLWTIIPVIILIIIVIPSIKLLYFMDRSASPQMTLKVTGYQWYWGFEYPDHGDLAFEAHLIPDDEIDPARGQLRLLSTDNAVILPIDTDIRILATATDVIHSFAVPAFAIKIDAMPGRVNETWVRITKPGVYYGQCSELCGKGHAYMPVEVRAVSKEEFLQWVSDAKTKFAGAAFPEKTTIASVEGVK